MISHSTPLGRAPRTGRPTAGAIRQHRRQRKRHGGQRLRLRVVCGHRAGDPPQHRVGKVRQSRRRSQNRIQGTLVICVARGIRNDGWLVVERQRAPRMPLARTWGLADARPPATPVNANFNLLPRLRKKPSTEATTLFFRRVALLCRARERYDHFRAIVPTISSPPQGYLAAGS